MVALYFPVVAAWRVSRWRWCNSRPGSPAGGSAWTLALLLLGLFAGALPTAANHLVGADWQMQYAGGNGYRLRLTLYLDAATGGAEANGDPTLTVATYRRQVAPGTVVAPVNVFQLPRVAVQELPGLPACAALNVPTRALTYEAILLLEPGLYEEAGGYYVAWERCCRNGLLTNITDAIGTGMLTYLAFPALRANGNARVNSVPQFRAAPRAAAYCLGDNLQLAFGATDADGDSLAYSLVPALRGTTDPANPLATLPAPQPYPGVTYSAGFSYQRPLPGNFTLDPRTGELRGVATALGTFQVAVRCQEWRRGQLLGENRRELEVSIANCTPNRGPSLTAVGFNPAVPQVVSGAADRCLRLALFDPDFGQKISVRLLGGGGAVDLSPASYTVPYPAEPATLTLCWRDCSVPATVPLLLIATDDGCQPSRPDTLRLVVRVAPAPNVPPILRRLPATPDTLLVLAGEELTFTVEAADPDPADPLRLTVALGGANGVVVAPLTGTGLLQARVTWRPTCEAARAAPYVLKFAATDGGCQPTDSLRVPVLVRAAPVLLPAGTVLPNVITPNADGRNDCFGLGVAPGATGNCGGRAGFGGAQIFNRWGQRVFETTDPAFCWAAAGVGAGTYYYLVYLPEGRTVRGLVTVVR